VACALFLKLNRRVPEHFDQIGASATCGIEDNYALVGKAPRASQFLAQERVNLRDLVTHYLSWRIPDAKFFAEVGIKRFEKRFVEIHDRGGCRLFIVGEGWKLEASKKQFAVDAAKRLGCDVQMLGKAKFLDAGRVPEFVKEAAEERDL